MADLRDAVQSTVVAALRDADGVTLQVWQHPPEKTEPPYHLFGELNAEAAGGKDAGLDRFEFEIETHLRAPGREHLTPHMAAVRAAIEGQALIAAGAVLSRPVLESEGDSLLDDGVTYAGVQRFSLFAQAE